MSTTQNDQSKSDYLLFSTCSPNTHDQQQQKQNSKSNTILTTNRKFNSMEAIANQQHRQRISRATMKEMKLVSTSYCRRRHQLRLAGQNLKCHNITTATHCSDVYLKQQPIADEDFHPIHNDPCYASSINDRLNSSMSRLSPPMIEPTLYSNRENIDRIDRMQRQNARLIGNTMNFNLNHTRHRRMTKKHSQRNYFYKNNWLITSLAMIMLILLALSPFSLASSLINLANQQGDNSNSQQHQHHLHQSTISVMTAPEPDNVATLSSKSNNNSTTTSAVIDNNNKNIQQQIANGIQQRSVRQQQQPKGQCHVQRLTQQAITNLSQIVFEPSDICSNWQQMLNSNINPSQQQQDNSNDQPWTTIEFLDLSDNKLQVLESNSFAHLTSLRALKISYNQLQRCGESTLANLKQLKSIDLSSNKLVALHNKFFAPVQATIEQLYLQNNSISVLTPGLFQQLTSLQHLDLSRNEITSHWLNSDIFSDLHQLKYLDLSYNRISRIDPTTFQSLAQLETLSLQRNELSQIPSTIGHLVSLIALDLSFNSLQDISNASYLGTCQQLYSLVLESNKIENITRGSFSNLPSIKVLNLANNRIKMIDQSTFEDVLELHALRLDSNRINDIGQMFDGLHDLLMLNISSNHIQTFDFVQIPLGLQWLDLSHNQVDRLSYYYYSATMNQASLDANGVANIRLKTLEASHNNIQELDRGSLPDSLEIVNLSNNKIRLVAPSTFATKANLTKVNLSHNLISTIPMKAFELSLGAPSIASNSTSSSSASSNLPSTWLRSNTVDIQLAHNPLVCDCTMEWFSRLLQASNAFASILPPQTPGQQLTTNSGRYSAFTGNGSVNIGDLLLLVNRMYPYISDFSQVTCKLPFARRSPSNYNQWSPLSQQQQQLQPISNMHLCPYKSHCIAQCHCCDFDACDCEMTCPDNCSCYYDQTWKHTNIVDCSSSNKHQNRQKQPSSLPALYSDIPGKIPMDVTELYLDGQQLTQLRSNSFIGRKNLKILYLNASQINSIDNRTFVGLKVLKVLQLSNNQLTKLSGHEFEQMSELQELYLAHNQLSSIHNSTFVALKQLQVLHLQGNNLYHFQFWQLNINIKLRSLRLGSNPWSCQCELVEQMFSWLPSHSNIIEDTNQITCQHNETARLHLTAMQQHSSSIARDMHPMFHMKLCLNHTVEVKQPSKVPSINTINRPNLPSPSDPLLLYPHYDHQPRQRLPTQPAFVPSIMPPSRGLSPNPFSQQVIHPSNPYFSPQDPSSQDINQGSASTSFSDNLPNDDPHLYPSHHHEQQSPIYTHPPASNPNLPNSLGTMMLVIGGGATVVLLVLIVMSFVYYRRDMSIWFYTKYGIRLCSSSRSSHSGSSGGSSSGAGFSLGNQKGTKGIIVGSGHHTLGGHHQSAALRRADEDKLFDAYMSYSKKDEAFINEFLAPELEYGQPVYR